MAQERSILKKAIYNKLNAINKELSRIESMKNFPNADMKTLSIKESCLSQHKKDIEDLIAICVDRNRF